MMIVKPRMKSYKNLAFRECVTVHENVLSAVIFNGGWFVLQQQKLSVYLLTSCFATVCQRRQAFTYAFC